MPTDFGTYDKPAHGGFIHAQNGLQVRFEAQKEVVRCYDRPTS